MYLMEDGVDWMTKFIGIIMVCVHLIEYIELYAKMAL